MRRCDTENDAEEPNASRNAAVGANSAGKRFIFGFPRDALRTGMSVTRNRSEGKAPNQSLVRLLDASERQFPGGLVITSPQVLMHPVVRQ